MEPEVTTVAAGAATNLNYAIAFVMMAAPSFAALAIGWIGASATAAIGRNPEAAPRIQTAMILTAAFAEAIAIYCLVVGLILKFV
jgi:F-type H+-transporting ATPase subunit c